MRPRASIAVLVGGAPVVAACGDVGSTGAADDAEDVVHVHELLAGPAGEYFVATHSGLYRVADDGLDRVGAEQHDLMSAAMADDGTFLASGHPDLRTGELRVENRPPLLGLVSSTTGEAWESMSLLGESDFHGIVVVDLDDGLVSSIDGGETWTGDDAADGIEAPFTDLEWTTDGQAALDENGIVHHRAGPGERWVMVEGIDKIDALGIDGDRMLAITLPNHVHHSDDGGRTWALK